MNPKSIILSLEQQGIRLEAGVNLAFTSAEPITRSQLDILERHKSELGAYLLTDREMIPRLPWQLDRLVRAASSGLLTLNLPGILDANTYTLAWACAYLTGGGEEALRRLTQVYDAWQAQG